MAKKLVIENLRRDRVHIPVADAEAAKNIPGVIEGMFVLGDKSDTDDKVPADAPGGRNEHLQPHPRRTLTLAQYEALGPFAHGIIDDLVGQGRVQKTELAA